MNHVTSLNEIETLLDRYLNLNSTEHKLIMALFFYTAKHQHEGCLPPSREELADIAQVSHESAYEALDGLLERLILVQHTNKDETEINVTVNLDEDNSLDIRYFVVPQELEGIEEPLLMKKLEA